jgi:LuxR family transcriptional regulator, maltose regulon positive regulatory protein
VEPTIRSPIGPKYSVPGLPHPFVRRPRVDSLLSGRRRRRFTVVSGLPGAGKTTLAAAWARSSPRRQVAWVNLDAHDNEPGRFARAVIGALVGASALADEVDDIDLVPGADTAALDVILGRLAPGGWTLVVDDAHELRSPEAIATLGHLLERSPEALSMILCTRADPPVAVGRLRLSGRLGEIRNADLEFTREEATELFAAHGLGTVPDDVRALWSRTGGSATATEEVVADYLVEELLARQDERTQSFLLCTSITHHLTPELAACVAGIDVDEARERLDRLQGTGVFITTSDPDGYRHHALFAELLRACLRHRHPEVVPELHRRAASWHRAAGLLDGAEVHARAGADWDLLGRLLIESSVAEALAGSHQAPDALDGVPDDAIASVPGLALVAAMTACWRGEREAADRYRGVVDRLVEQERPASNGSSQWTPARAVLDLEHGWAFGADERARAAPAWLRASAAERAAHDAGRLAALREAELHVDEGRFDAAAAALHELANGSRGGWVATEARAMLALIDAANGAVALAEPLVDCVLDASAERATGGGGLLVAIGGTGPAALRAAHLAGALCCCLRGEQRSAADHVNAAEAAGPVASRTLDAVLRALQSLTAGRVARAAWLDSATAHQPLTELALVAAGVVEVIDPDRRLVVLGGPGERALARARQDLTVGAFDTARAGISAWLGAAGGAAFTAHPRTIVEAHTLASAAAAGSDDIVRARRDLHETLDLVAASGIRAPLLDHGRLLVDLLQREASGPDHHVALAVELLDRLRHAPAGPGVESLTDRETAVLRFLPTLMSNAQIADGMNLSVNTVKSHLKAVYRKLGVDGRREAVLRGRELELL